MTEPEKRQGRRRFGTNSVTMADVAQVAGVSAQTVSRVCGVQPSGSRSTRERVEAPIRSTRYVQNLSLIHI